jgi:hypothetical protein
VSALLDSLCGSARLEECAKHETPPVMRGYVVQVKRGAAIRLTFDVFGTDSCTVAAQHQGMCEPGEYVTVSPRRFGFSEEQLVEADLQYLASQAQRIKDTVRLAHELELSQLQPWRQRK